MFQQTEEERPTQARDDVARSEAVDAERGRRARAEQQHRRWPDPGRRSVRIGLSGKADQTVGGLPISVSPVTSGGASGTTDIQVLGQTQAEAAGVRGVLLSAAAERPGKAELRMGYADFASAYGGGWSGRLRLVELPPCALTTPERAVCRAQRPLDSHNDIAGQAVSATVDLVQAGTAAATTPAVTVLALVAAAGESSSGSGNYAATPLSASSTWQAGSSSGSFGWSYGLDLPPAAAGPTPVLSLSYDSGSIDGRTASTNNQGTMVGEGFDLTSSYIERSYGSCDDDGQDGKYDLCWKYDNASLVLNGKSTELVKDDTTGVWRLKDDDASTVTPSRGAANGDDDGEYWTVVTGDGTKYVFGLNKLDGAGTERTNSVWTVPVFGDDAGEPGYTKGSTYADRWLEQAWRWNLDYVEDLHGNATTYWYTVETNTYARDGATKADAGYTRGGYLTQILYGQRKGALFTGNSASDKVTFDYAERCTASDCSSLTKNTAHNWPDVPFDSICASGADDCKATSPSFFTRKRLTGVNTLAWSAADTKYAAVDSWALAQAYQDPGDIGDSSDQVLTLTSIQHTGKNGTAVSLNPVKFTYKMLPNRVDGQDHILPLTRPRIYEITSETGGITSVTFSPPECVRGSSLPAEDSNTGPCYPQYWHINGAKEASIDWFHKYRVTTVLSSDPTGHSDAVETTYTYSGPAWHYNDSPFVPTGERTWSVWRGYRQVTTLMGTGPNQSRTVALYLQGMDGDRKKDGGKRSVSVPGISFTGLSVADQKDSEPYAGMPREQVTYNGTTPIGVTVNDPWSKKTATQHKSYADTESYYLRTARSYAHTYLTAKAAWRTTMSETTRFDDYGMPELVFNAGDTAVTGDETCTRAWFARNAALGLISLTSRTRVVGRACTTAETDLNLPTTAATRGDVLSDTAVVYDSAGATTWTASQSPTKGEPTWTGRASAYPATATGGERNPTTWQTTAKKMTYDTLGRPLSVTDDKDNPTSTAYAPAAAGPLTRTAVTNAMTQRVVTDVDFARGLTVRVTDANNKRTDTAYDALGRTTAIWLPNRDRAATQSANYTFAYHEDTDKPSWVSTSSIHTDTTYNTSYDFYDALQRPLQTQSPAAGGGRLLTDTRYDSRGLAYQTYAEAYDSTRAPNGAYTRIENGGAPKQTGTTFDGAGRPVTSSLYVFGVKQCTTSASYTGDSTATTALDGGSATRVITDALGRTTERREYASTSPDDKEYGAAGGAAYTFTAHTYTRDGLQDTLTGPDKARWSYGYDLFGRLTSSTDPGTGTTTTAYTSLDQVDWTRDAAGKTLAHTYDVLGRQTAQYSSTTKDSTTQLAGWSYDSLAKGRLDSSTRYDGGKAVTTRVTAYDSLYRATGTQLTLPADDPLVTSKAVTSPLTFTSYYNVDGTQQSSSQPAAGGLGAETITTDHDNLGLPTAVRNGTGTSYLLGADYSPTGQPWQLSLGTSAAPTAKKAYLTNEYQAGTDRLVTSLATDQTHDYKLQQLSYTYDDAGDVTSLTDLARPLGGIEADNQCFAYDGYQRLTEAWTPKSTDCSAGGRTTANIGGAAPYWSSWTYDDAGLRTTQKDNTAGTTTRYCYGTTTFKQPHALAATTAASTCDGAANTYDYDQTGNTTKRPAPENSTGSETLTWDSEGHLKALAGGAPTTASTSYLYDVDGSLLIRRPANPTGTGETVLYLGPTEVHLNNNGTSTSTWAQRYYTAAGQSIALRSNQNAAEKVSFLAGDNHGTAGLAIEAATQTYTKRYTTPYGAPRGATADGTWPDDKQFLGRPTDTTTGLTHIGAREYDPTTGRFLSVDPLLTVDQHQSLNGYAYANNNPTTLSDPTGLRPDGICGSSSVCKDASGQTVHESFWSTSKGWAYSSYDNVLTTKKNPTTYYGGNKKAFLTDTLKSKSAKQRITESAELLGMVPILGTPGDVLVTSIHIAAGDWESVKWDAVGFIPVGGDALKFLHLKKQAEAAEDLLRSCAKHSFATGADVKMSDGSHKDIEDIKIGDKVLATDPVTGETEPRAVQAVIVTDHDKDFTDLTIQTGTTRAAITATDTHPFWVISEGRWVNAGDIHPGMTLRKDDGTAVPVVSIRHFHKKQRTYDLTVEGIHTYYVLAGQTPVLVHNSNCDVPSGSLQGEKLAQKLRLESANSPFAESGQLTPDAISGSRLAMPGTKMGNKGLQARFAERGGASQWGKYSTETHQSPYGDYQVHYYMNRVSGEVMYDYDYKVVMNRRGSAP
ncbi:RHS repeat-associated core domain-containing protein [Streptomyces sp. NPDC051569]|uniref:RHS repeat-associated core domain-containing protein n=1 Tax=Streptomyces sp. NPDC051569 TaxID=3365661 RepID=UPI0037B57B65